MKNILNFNNFINEKKKKNPCWDGYTMVGMKKKNGKKVPNCVPNKDNKIEEPEETNEKKSNGIPERYKKMGFEKVGQKKKSTRTGKKWMVLAKKGDKYKVVHGGDSSMKDYSQHKDKDRKKAFWDRMGGKDSDKAKDPFSPLYWHKKFGTW